MIANSIEELRKQHPDWSEDQIQTANAIRMEAEKKITEAGNIDETNEVDIVKAILDGARRWLSEVLPDVFTRVSSFFDRAISTVGEWIQKGLSYAVELIAKLLGK